MALHVQQPLGLAKTSPDATEALLLCQVNLILITNPFLQIFFSGQHRATSTKANYGLTNQARPLAHINKPYGSQLKPQGNVGRI